MAEEKRLTLKCKDCGRVFYNDAFKDLCFPCFNLKRYRDSTKLPCSSNSLGKSDSERAELKPPNLLPTTEAETTGFENEARLLESKEMMANLWAWANTLEPKPPEEQAASLAATVFIDVTKDKRFDRIKR